MVDSVSADDRTQPVTERIARIVEAVPGWTPPDELLVLHTLATVTAPLGGDIVEIGSWCGRSTAVLGHAVAATGVGRVWAIDLFPSASDWRKNADGTHSLTVSVNGKRIGGYEDQTVWDEPFQRDIATIYERFDSVFDAFRSTVDSEGLGSVISSYRGTGSMFAAQAPADLRVRLGFLDGDHSYAAVCADIDVLERFLVPGGWIAFDDAFSVYDGVDAAIRDRILSSDRYECAQQLCRKLFVARRR